MKHFLFLLLALPLVLVSCNPDEDDSELSGCMDPDAVNFSANATVDDGSCVYGELSGCMDPDALNFSANATVDDGSCVYGESSGCGGASTVTYDGYTYALVAIGDQCWFAENLRNEHYANGDVIPGELNDGEWSSTTNGAQAVYATTRPTSPTMAVCTTGTRWMMRVGCVQAVGTYRRMGSL